MTYQPVYGIVCDENCTRTTSSRWGKVNIVNFNGLTHFGQAIEVTMRSDGKLPRKDVEEAERKIVKWAEQGKLKRVEDWAVKLRERKAYNNEQEKTEQADIEITIKNNEKLHYTINGVKITPKLLSLIRDNEEFLNKLEITNNLENEKK